MGAPTATLRTSECEKRYQLSIAEGRLHSLRDLPAIDEWQYWRLVENEYPYDRAFKTHHLLVLKRKDVGSRSDLTIPEWVELEKIIQGYVYSHYHLWFENSPPERSVPNEYHIHVALRHDSYEGRATL